MGQLHAAQGLIYSARKNYETALRLIVEKLEAATAKLESASVTEIRLPQREIETLTAQRDHVVSQLSSLS